VVAEFLDNGISGSKGRDACPGLDQLLGAMARRVIEMVMAWSVDRLGRSLQNLVEFLGELHGKRVDARADVRRADLREGSGEALVVADERGI
jgi:DNA invertase Pin-like site-specific DNA recombinase